MSIPERMRFDSDEARRSCPPLQLLHRVEPAMWIYEYPAQESVRVVSNRVEDGLIGRIRVDGVDPTRNPDGAIFGEVRDERLDQPSERPVAEAELHRANHESAGVGHRLDLLTHESDAIDSARRHLGQEFTQRFDLRIEVVVAVDDHLLTPRMTGDDREDRTVPLGPSVTSDQLRSKIIKY
jgi:hypothetical protein